MSDSDLVKRLATMLAKLDEEAGFLRQQNQQLIRTVREQQSQFAKSCGVMSGLCDGSINPDRLSFSDKGWELAPSDESEPSENGSRAPHLVEPDPIADRMTGDL